MAETEIHPPDILLQRVRREENSKESDSSISTSAIKLPPDYNKFELPRPGNSAMPLFAFINISKVLDWDEENERITLDMRLKVMWTDFRILEFNNNTHPGNGKPLIEYLTQDEIDRMRKTNNDPSILDSVWNPNLFIEKLLKVKQPKLMSPPLVVRFIPEYGWFEYITRVQIFVDCSMDFSYYPADTQVCPISLRSYSYTKSDMNLTWYNVGAYLNDLEVSSFEVRIGDVSHSLLAKSNDPNEVFEIVGFKIFGRRRLSYHLIQTYLASSFYIVITTLCFLLPSSMIEARIGMSMTTLLTLTAMFGSVRESTPIVSYTKAIDIWMVGCIFFVFLTLFQFTFLTWVRQVNKMKLEEHEKKVAEMNGVQNGAFESDLKLRYSESTNNARGLSTEKPTEMFKNLSQFLETYSFPLFLGIFAVYSASYWHWLLSSSDHFDWSVNSTWNRI